MAEQVSPGKPPRRTCPDGKAAGDRRPNRCAGRRSRFRGIHVPDRMASAVASGHAAGAKDAANVFQ